MYCNFFYIILNIFFVSQKLLENHGKISEYESAKIFSPVFDPITSTLSSRGHFPTET